MGTKKGKSDTGLGGRWVALSVVDGVYSAPGGYYGGGKYNPSTLILTHKGVQVK